jgi:hypothetical protein
MFQFPVWTDSVHLGGQVFLHYISYTYSAWNWGARLHLYSTQHSCVVPRGYYSKVDRNSLIIVWKLVPLCRNYIFANIQYGHFPQSFLFFPIVGERLLYTFIFSCWGKRNQVKHKRGQLWVPHRAASADPVFSNLFNTRDGSRRFWICYWRIEKKC